MARHAPVDEGSPARLIVVMVGIVGILLLGSLAWSAVGALFTGLREAARSITNSGTPVPKLVLAVGTPSPQAGATATDTAGTPASVAGTQTIAAHVTQTPTAEPSVALTPTAEIALTPTPAATGRQPWILLPQPAPGTHVPAGSQVIEARGRGDTAITAIKLELDGTPLGVSLEQRSDSTWRGSSTAQVGAGQHAVRATVVDDQGRTGSFRWTFDAGP